MKHIICALNCAVVFYEKGANKNHQRHAYRENERAQEMKCVHSRLNLIGLTHWLLTRSQLQTMLVQQTHTHTHSFAVLIIYEQEI